MMKHSFATGVGLALIFVVPTAVIGKQSPETLQQTLDRTLAALEQLAGLDQRLSKHDATAIREAIAWTEPGLTVSPNRPQARDEELDALRHEVVALQGELDGDTQVGSSSQTPSATAASSEHPLKSAPTTGLNDAARHALRPTSSAPNTTPAGVPPVSASTPAAKHAFEASGYTADPLELGRAYYRREKFESALVQFESQGTNIEATYWKARCLERLNKTSDAIAAYDQVIASPSAGALVARAKDDLEFLRWRIAIEGAKKPAPAKKEQP